MLLDISSAVPRTPTISLGQDPSRIGAIPVIVASTPPERVSTEV